jgi:cysteine synthase
LRDGTGRRESLKEEARRGVLSLIGNTPVVEIMNINPNPKVRILAKLEGFNPCSSVKDRIALYMIEGAEATGELTGDMTILEPTSGNTGIGLAMVASVKGYKIKIIMPETMSRTSSRTPTTSGRTTRGPAGRSSSRPTRSTSWSPASGRAARSWVSAGDFERGTRS